MYALRDPYLPRFLQKVVFEFDPELLTVNVTIEWSTKDFFVFNDYYEARDFAVKVSPECCVEIWDISADI